MPAFPRIWYVPHLRNPSFVGREELLAGIRDGRSTERAETHVQAIHGLGGIGKTQIAVEYAYRNAANYSAIWWVRADDLTTLASDYAALSVLC